MATATAKQFDREALKDLFVDMGIKSAGDWDDAKLLSRIKGLPKFMESDEFEEPTTASGKKLLKSVVAAVKADADALELTGSNEPEEDEEEEEENGDETEAAADEDEPEEEEEEQDEEDDEPEAKKKPSKKSDKKTSVKKTATKTTTKKVSKPAATKTKKATAKKTAAGRVERDVFGVRTNSQAATLNVWMLKRSKAGKPFTVQDVAAALEVSPNTAWGNLNRLIHKGFVKKNSDGKGYLLFDKKVAKASPISQPKPTKNVSKPAKKTVQVNPKRASGKPAKKSRKAKK